MKKITFLIIFLISNFFFAQSDSIQFHFDKKYYEAVDEWVVFPKQQTDSAYTYGFVYIDEMAGFTFRYKNKLQLKKRGLVPAAKDSLHFILYRLTPNTKLVHLLNEKQRKQLGLPNKPEWLSNYKINSGEVSYLKKIGYFYNHVGGSKQALQPLIKAYKKEPHFEGLEFELAYAYNATGQYDKAISVLKTAIENNPENAIFYRELGFAYLRLEKIKEAEKIYRKGIELSDKPIQKSEMAVNMSQAYFMLKNKEKFDEWAAITRKYAEKGSPYAQYIDLFEEKWNEDR